VVIHLERGADCLHMVQLMPLPLIVSCFSKIQIGLTFLVPAHPGSPRQMVVKQVRMCVLSGRVPEFIVHTRLRVSLEIHRFPGTFYRPDGMPLQSLDPQRQCLSSSLLSSIQTQHQEINH